MRPDTGGSDALWSLGRVTPTPARLRQALTACPAGVVVRGPGPLPSPDRVLACIGTPPGHRQTHHPPDRLLPAACRVSASCREFPSPYRRWRTPPRGHTGAHQPPSTGGTPLRMGVPPLPTPPPPLHPGRGLPPPPAH